MSFNTALSGVNAAQRDLNVTSNNIANANSTGFKKSRAEFGDIYATSAFGNSKTAVGQGVLNQAVSQQFSQGSLQFTDNALDMAIQGEGFFVFQPTADSDEAVYSRAGAINVDKDGFLVNPSGQFLKGYDTDDEGNLTGLGLDLADRIQIDPAAGDPNATTEVEQRVRLPAQADKVVDDDFNSEEDTYDNFDPRDPDTYNISNSQRIYDSLGAPRTLTTYYAKTGDNEWSAFYSVDGRYLDADVDLDDDDFDFDDIDESDWHTIAEAEEEDLNYQAFALRNIKFDPADQGRMKDSTVEEGDNSDTFTLPEGVFANGAAELEFDVTISPQSRQVEGDFAVEDQSQNGNTVGELTGLEVGNDGLVRASYSNGTSAAVAKVALADFRNPQGLEQIGNNQWRESNASGEPRAGEANVGTFGSIQAGALEASNVDLTEELVNMITAQRNFQANSRAIETNKTLSDTIVNIR